MTAMKSANIVSLAVSTQCDVFDDHQRRIRLCESGAVDQCGQTPAPCIGSHSRAWPCRSRRCPSRSSISSKILRFGLRQPGANLFSHSIGTHTGGPCRCPHQPCHHIERDVGGVRFAVRGVDTGTPRPAAFATVSRTRRLLPIPGGPTTVTTLPAPPTASSSSEVTVLSSHVRPTNGESLRLPRLVLADGQQAVSPAPRLGRP